MSAVARSLTASSACRYGSQRGASSPLAVAGSAVAAAGSATATGSGGVFTGLGSPWWDPYARGAIVGITRGTTREHLARAALEGIAYQTVDAVRAQERVAGRELSELRADGGAVANRWLMQFQADVLGAPVVVPAIAETTALGAAYLAGIATGRWSAEQVAEMWREAARFEPRMGADERESLLAAVMTAGSHTLVARWDEFWLPRLAGAAARDEVRADLDHRRGGRWGVGPVVSVAPPASGGIASCPTWRPVRCGRGCPRARRSGPSRSPTCWPTSTG